MQESAKASKDSLRFQKLQGNSLSPNLKRKKRSNRQGIFEGSGSMMINYCFRYSIEIERNAKVSPAFQFFHSHF